MDQGRNISEYIQALVGSDRLGDQVVCHRILPPARAGYAEPEKPWSPPLRAILSGAGTGRLYAHQSRAIDLIRQGKNVVIATPTASGKSLIYNLPVIEDLCDEPFAHALYLFPLKALTQDQIRGFRDLAGLAMPGPTAAIYDGDTTAYRRRKLREAPPNVIFTNPDMLHLGFLAHHHNWESFFANLRYVVVDEVHTYRGIMGSNMALVFSRLRRICSHYGANPVFVFCSATISNPAELASRLTGLDVELIDESTAPTGKKHVVFLNPTEGGPRTTLLLLKAAMHRGLRSIVYTQSRKLTELVAMWAQQNAGEFADRVSAYRAGYLPEERREIEARLKSGELLAVIATSALELGIDIGDLDLCILVGYPGTVMATLQRGGRVGRDLSESAVVLVAGEDALDQYFMRHPEDFFSRESESAVINPENPVLLARHLVCAAAELPLEPGEPIVAGQCAAREMDNLESRGELLRDEEGDVLYAARKRPHKDVDLRGSGAQFALVDGDGGQTIGQMDRHRVYYEAHPGAIYLHLGQTYRVDDLDEGSATAVAKRVSVDYYTRARSSKQTEIVEVYGSRRVFGTRVFHGELRVTDHVTGFEKRRVRTGQSLGVFPLDLPPHTFITTGIWIEIPERVRRAAEDEQMHFMGGIHAIEHAAIGILPVLAMCDRNDLGGISTPFHLQVGRAAVFVYDSAPGGVGLAGQAWADAGELLVKTANAIASCPCENGCPSCVHSPKCGSGNRPIDKRASLFVLRRLLDSGPVAAGRERAGKDVPGRARRVSAPVRHVVAERPAPRVAADGNAPPPTGPARSAGAGRSPQPAPVRETWVPAPPPDLDGSLHYGVFDLETQRSADEVGGWGRIRDMGMSCGVLYDSRKDDYLVFYEKDAKALIENLRGLDLVVGFNIIRFDYTVLKGYSRFDFRGINTLDMLDVVYARLGYRLSLEHLATNTLGAAKTAHGLQAVAWWREGKIAEIVKYCRADVEITRNLYWFGKAHKYLLFQNKAKKRVRVPIDW
ncbi:MAG: DEAD/DEAH box helicase [Desulfatibacillaceae bacterium]